MFPALILTSGLAMALPEQRRDELAFPPPEVVPADMLRNTLSQQSDMLNARTQARRFRDMRSQVDSPQVDPHRNLGAADWDKRIEYWETELKKLKEEGGGQPTVESVEQIIVVLKKFKEENSRREVLPAPRPVREQD